ncbi:UDP-glucose 4-epimerase GalE [Flavobacteriaceae bacterium]|nr:UDP-glucose 4-epimerase GalE [Flavobacteriaceae bacterium]MDA9887471.1 UDP-glucose 4-epimerase GalE [Flavobacteriaceae bacterium]MDB9941767.1 UDP-glucose 4-epimerase GalE [Flavobacteriaceae bacterium]MDC1401642.1 UDP-glucose 4-epimerase GalE [Flavobacteriaceae bacterium]
MDPKKKIIITGGTGYIGSHTSLALIQEGFDVVIVDDLSNSEASVLDRIAELSKGVKPQFEKIDLSNFEHAYNFLKKHSDACGVINFAAFKAVGESVQKPLVYYRNNLSILINILECMQEFNMTNFIFSSSATVYGIPNQLPITEDEPTKRPTSPYGNTKKIGEEILDDFSRNQPMFSAISLRYFNPIGAHPSGKLGESPVGIPNNLMPFITQTASGIREELKVFGKDYKTKDGTNIRDYIHVVDLAEAHVLALKRLLNKTAKDNFEIFNIGTGIGYSVLDVITSFERTTKQKLNYSFTDRRQGDVPELFADSTKANQLLNWQAKFNLDDMTSSSWNFQNAKK